MAVHGMTGSGAPTGSEQSSRGPLVAFALVAVLCVLLVGAAVLRSGSITTGPAPGGGPPASPVGGAASAVAPPSPTPLGIESYLYPDGRPAPPIALTDQAAQPFTLASLRGQIALVFFGYTHCPDVCPDTIGKIETALDAFDAPAHAVFVTVDPARDTVAWLGQYVAYLPATFTALTGTEAQIRATADAWGVRYARTDTGDPSAYSMSHTADVYLVDAAGTLRGHLPYGTSANEMRRALEAISTPLTGGSVSPSASASPSSASALLLQPEVVTSSVWAGANVPVIFAVSGPAGRIDDATAAVSVQLTAADGTSVGTPVRAVAVQPPGVADVSWVATLTIPSPAAYRFAVTAQTGALPLHGSTGLITALDQGATPLLGSAVPTIATPTAESGDLRALSTDPIPDARLYGTSTADALAAHQPFVLVMDSTKFRVTSACGKALVMVKYLLDRWRDVTFIHHEPFRYDVELDTPVLQGTLQDPVLTHVADAWGLGTAPWSATSMPWIFIVDRDGILRAKYQGVVGSADVDVILSLIAQGG